MISIWEAFQGLAFMGVFGCITRTAFQDRPRKRLNAPQTPSRASVHLPLPRRAAEEHDSLTIG